LSTKFSTGFPRFLHLMYNGPRNVDILRCFSLHSQQHTICIPIRQSMTLLFCQLDPLHQLLNNRRVRCYQVYTLLSRGYIPDVLLAVQLSAYTFINHLVYLQIPTGSARGYLAPRLFTAILARFLSLGGVFWIIPSMSHIQTRVIIPDFILIRVYAFLDLW